MTVKKVKIFDGVFSGTRVTVDANDTSKVAIMTLRDMLDANTPRRRIASIEKFLDNLSNPSEIAMLRVNEIRENIAEIKQLYPDLSLDLHGLKLLDNAEMWRKEIKVLPLTVKGETFSRGKPRGAKSTKTEYINKLATDSQNTSAKELFKIADKAILNEGRTMQLSTFVKKVSIARNPK